MDVFKNIEKGFEKNKFQFAIDSLNKLDSILQGKIMKLQDMSDESDKDQNDSVDKTAYYSNMIKGVKIAKEEIRREIADLKSSFNLKMREYE